MINEQIYSLKGAQLDDRITCLLQLANLYDNGQTITITTNAITVVIAH